MFGLGTIINAAAIVLGGILGMLFGKLLKEHHQNALTTVCGVSVLFIGIDGALEGMLRIENGQLVGLKLYYLPKDADLQVGDTIVTSGLGGIFPKGLYVGKVLFLADEDNGAYDACVVSDVDFEHLEEVLIILGKES